jgi:hypothetical protein
MVKIFLATSVMVISLITAYWFGSDTSWEMFPPDFLGYYENHGARILQGYLDVDCSAIQWEAFQKDGKCYGYFGPVPSLIRVPLTALFPRGAYHWTLVSILSGILFTLLAARGLIRDSLESIIQVSSGEKLFIELLLLANIGLGSTLLTMSSPSFIYHESVLWSAAFVLVSAVALIRYLKTLRTSYAIIAVVMAALAVNTRPSIGFGAVIMLLLAFGLAPMPSCGANGSRREWVSPWLVGTGVTRYFKRHLALVLLVSVVASTPFVLSWAKFGEFSLYPYKYYIGNDQHRLARTKGNFFPVGNFFFNGVHYLNPAGVDSSPVFPYFKLAPKDWGWRDRPGVHFDRGEPFLPVTVAMPLWVLLAIAGLLGVARYKAELHQRIPALVGTLMGGSVIFVLAAIMNRYVHDLFPFLIIAGTAGVVWLDCLNKRSRILVYGMATVLTCGSIYMNLSNCMLNIFAGQRVNQKLMLLRAKFDGTRISVPVADIPLFNAKNGIINDPQNRKYGVILPDQIPLGLTAGAIIIFAGSGERKVVDFSEIGGNTIIFVDGPLDFEHDGSPATVRYLSIPCDSFDCGATRLDE